MYLDAGEIYAVVAAGCRDAYDIDLELISPSGRLVLRDTDAAPVAGGVFTDPESGLYRVSVAMYRAKWDGAHWTLFVHR